jgi:two-component system LytT family response regulator
VNCVIIEDEINSRLLLQEILSVYFPDVKLLGVGSSVDEGIALIRRLSPDVILMDIEILGGSGFDILDGIDNNKGRVIFITGYEHFALKAIKYAALDYLLKPVSIPELKAAFAKVSLENQSDNRIQFLRDNLHSGIPPEQIMVSHNKGYTLIPLKNICYLEANGPYVYINLDDGRKILAGHSLGYYEEILDKNAFFRVHKSFIISMSKVVRIITNPSPKVLLIRDISIDLAFRRKEAFIEHFKKLNPN